jgi:glutathione-regulated potassium-efflux system protein KefB
LRTAQLVKQRYPHVPIYARSRHRRHTHQLMDLGIKVIRRETFLSSLDLTGELLRGLGLSERDVRFAIETFKTMDRKRLYEDYKHYTDQEKLQERAKSLAQELDDIFAQDAAAKAEEKTTT